MSFKDMVDRDRLGVFLDLNFFGEMYEVEYNPIPIVLDSEELKERQGGQDLAVAESQTLFYARSEDLPQRRSAGQSLNVNGKECLIDSWTEEMGIATVVLRQNIVT